MSNEIIDNACDGNKQNKVKKFRMAYSLNNKQPVQCTLISDQPFFYMEDSFDAEDDYLLDEDYFMDGAEISEEDLLSEINSMKDKMSAYDAVSKECFLTKNQRLDQFKEDSDNMTLGQSAVVQTTLKDIEAFISKSRMATALYKQAQDNGVKIILSNQVENSAYDANAKTIFVRADIDIAEKFLLVVQELRHSWQDHNGAAANPLQYHPDQAILINRSQKADLAMAIIHAAWELKLSGDKTIWQRIESSSISDLGRAFAREAISDFRTLNDGKAASALFETWFLSERPNFEDKELIHMMMADHQNYDFTESDQSEKVLVNFICKLGEQPFGNNYLAKYAHMIMSDTLFTDVRDRANANFLWFIKFEQTFKETEQELQSSEVIKIAGIDQHINNKEDNQDEHGSYQSDRLQSAEIVSIKFKKRR